MSSHASNALQGKPSPLSGVHNSLSSFMSPGKLGPLSGVNWSWGRVRRNRCHRASPALYQECTGARRKGATEQSQHSIRNAVEIGDGHPFISSPEDFHCLLLHSHGIMLRFRPFGQPLYDPGLLQYFLRVACSTFLPFPSSSLTFRCLLVVGGSLS